MSPEFWLYLQSLYDIRLAKQKSAKAMRAYHRPHDIHQRLLVDHMAKSQWLLARAQRLQAVA